VSNYAQFQQVSRSDTPNPSMGGATHPVMAGDSVPECQYLQALRSPYKHRLKQAKL